MYLFHQMILVALSNIDPNKYNRLHEYKRQIASAPNNNITQEANSIKRVDDHGETIKTKITQTQKHLSDSEITTIIKEYQDGATTYALAEKYDCNRNTISKCLKRHGIIVNNRRVKSEEEIQNIVQLYENGLNTEQIAKQYGISYTTVLKYLRDNGVKIITRWDYRK
jgi:uncharacterized protein (DUF433 family)